MKQRLTWVEPKVFLTSVDLLADYDTQLKSESFVETQDLQPVGSFPSTTNENTSSGDNTENQDTTSGNTSNTESTSTTDNNSLAYSGKDGSEPSEDLSQDIFDALWTRFYKSSALDNFLYSRNELDQTSRDYIR